MDAATIICDFTAKGVQLAPTDHGTISITPRSRLTDADRDLLRKHKADVLAELQSMNFMNIMNIDSGHLPPARIVRDAEPMFTPLASSECPDDYARLEREAIQAEADAPPDRGWDDVPFNAEPVGPFGRGVVTDHPDGSMTIRYLPDMKITRPPAPPPAPATVTCGSCAEFEPGKTPLGIGRCSRTLDGLPPVASRGYGACYPLAPRTCPDHKES
ncbi:hypothetical protein HF563_15305 [Acidithiobacillus ferridurans]|nr:hypothetical protein [Acidithiobacillus ferridurans]